MVRETNRQTARADDLVSKGFLFPFFIVQVVWENRKGAHLLRPGKF